MILNLRFFVIIVAAGVAVFLVTYFLPTTDSGLRQSNETSNETSKSATGTIEKTIVDDISKNNLEVPHDDKEDEKKISTVNPTDSFDESNGEKQQDAQEKEIALSDGPILTQPQPEDELGETLLPFSFINEETRKALVNILCTTKFGGSLKPITASGIIIDEKGVILTNAHIAQYFLLKDYQTKNFLECVIRQGSPAKPLYRAQLLYIPSLWVEDNAASIKLQEPKGTGENDYAFIIINTHVDKAQSPPETFPFIDFDAENIDVDVGNNVLIASYPAGFLGGIAVQKDLYITSTVTQIRDVFTFAKNTLDLLSIGGSIVAQQGSSGGAVVGQDNKLIGIIVTSSTGETTEERDLRAITVSHINNSLLKHEGYDIRGLLTGNLQVRANIFNTSVAPGLIKLLTDELDR